MDINNKVAIVTGGIGGIGSVTVEYLLRNGAEYVGIFDLQLPDDKRVVDLLTKLEQEFEKTKFGYFTCNVTNVEQFKSNYDDITKNKGYVDILVNNAATSCDKDVDLAFDVNSKAVIHNTLYAIENMGIHRLQKGGVVVNIGSFLGLQYLPLAPVYNATKHAVVAFTRSMKVHCEKLGVKVVCICPGMTDTNMIQIDSLRRNILDFVETSLIKKALELPVQKPDNVASGIVNIIKKGNPGDVWLVQNNDPPLLVLEPEVKTVPAQL